MHTMLAQEIVTKLKAARGVLLVMHRRPDPDSMGSAAAMAAFLERQNIPYRYYCSTPLPDEAALFDIDVRRLSLRQPRDLVSPYSDVICTFDAGDLQHAGLDLVTPSYTIVFDHHSTNTCFGHLNVIDTTCASTTELIYHFFQAVNFPVTARVGNYLLAGLLVDTDHFFNPATTATALEVAGALLSRGVTLPALRALLFERRGMASLKLMGEVLARLKKHPRYDLAITYLTEEDCARFKVSADEVEGIANLLNSVGDTKVMLVLKSAGGFLRGSLRTTRPDIDVGKLAAALGGGGHRKAAGFTIKGALTTEGGHVRVV